MSKKRKQLYLCSSIYFFVVLACAIFPPIMPLWNKIEPHVFGLPFAQFSILVFSVLLIVGFLVWFVLEGKLNEQETMRRKQGEPLEH